MAADAILSTRRLIVGYDNKEILPPLDMEVKPGELVGLIGANGAGKSTLLRTLAAAQRPVSGTISIGGANVAGLSPRALARKVAIVYTERISSSGLTARQVIALGRNPHISTLGRLHDNDHKAVEDAIKSVGIEHLADKYMSRMSDGERQKVMIARTLAQETPLVILDEPTTFLDVASRLEMFRLLRMMADKMGKAIVISTHEVAPLLKIADRLLLITADKQIVDDTPQAIISSGNIDRLFPASSQVRFSPTSGDFTI